jgi:hypothetical protein
VISSNKNLTKTQKKIKSKLNVLNEGAVSELFRKSSFVAFSNKNEMSYYR